MVLIGSVFHYPFGAIWLVETVTALDHVSISDLPLVFVITGLVIMHTVVEFVLGIGLVLRGRK